jgi:hypothetical protein
MTNAALNFTKKLWLDRQAGSFSPTSIRAAKAKPKLNSEQLANAVELL